MPERSVTCDVKVTNLGAVRLGGIQVPGADSGCLVPDELAAGAHFNCSVTRFVVQVDHSCRPHNLAFPGLS